MIGFSPEGRRREEAFYLSLDGNAQIEELLERDRMAEEQELLERDRLVEEQRIADLRHQRDMEQQCTNALSHEQSARNWANYVEPGARQIALEAVGHTRVRDADFYYQLVKWVSCLEAEASVNHAGMEKGQRVRAMRPMAPLACTRRGARRRCRRLACTTDGGRHHLVS